MPIPFFRQWIVMIGFFVFFSPVGFAQDPAWGEEGGFQEVQKETRELLQALEHYSADQRAEAMEKTKASLEDLDHRINALENRLDKSWDALDRSARQNARANLRTLRQQRTQVAEWYGRMKSSSKDAWGHMKEGFSEAYQSLYQAWQESEDAFERNR